MGTRPDQEAINLYLDLLKRTLTRLGFPESYRRIHSTRQPHRFINGLLQGFFGLAGFELVRKCVVRQQDREKGVDLPPEADTMIGLRRLDSLQRCIEDILCNGVPGDFIETGVWRGGACIFMRGMLKAYGESRVIWAADSFAGLPPPNAEKYPADEGDPLWSFPVLAVSLEEVQRNFQRYGLLDDSVHFLKGWFRDTLPVAPIRQLALMRLDGDMYESTMDALTNLYPKLAVGGWVIIDDYPLPNCRQAVHDFRAQQKITDPLVEMGDGIAAYWKRL